MIDRKPVRVAVLSQPDTVAIPRNIALLASNDCVELISVVDLNVTGALVNKRMLFLKGFGILQCVQMAVVEYSCRILDLLSRLVGHRLGVYSLKSAALASRAAYLVEQDPNDPTFVDAIKRDQIDLVVSYSAPCIFKQPLLDAPSLGCINLHCSLLPRYAGLLPSFWTLYHDEPEIGATVHLMDDKIDNGAILAQVRLDTPTPPSMFSVIRQTKEAGGRLVSEVVDALVSGSSERQPNVASKDEYYSWPTVDQIREFRARGGRLI